HGATADPETRDDAGVDGRADRLCGCADWRATCEQNAIWRQRERSAQHRGSGNAAVWSRATSMLSSGTVGQPRRSIGGATRGLMAAARILWLIVFLLVGIGVAVVTRRAVRLMAPSGAQLDDGFARHRILTTV